MTKVIKRVRTNFQNGISPSIVDHHDYGDDKPTLPTPYVTPAPYAHDAEIVKMMQDWHAKMNTELIETPPGMAMLRAQSMLDDLYPKRKRKNKLRRILEWIY